MNYVRFYLLTLEWEHWWEAVIGWSTFYRLTLLTCSFFNELFKFSQHLFLDTQVQTFWVTVGSMTASFHAWRTKKTDQQNKNFSQSKISADKGCKTFRPICLDNLKHNRFIYKERGNKNGEAGKKEARSSFVQMCPIKRFVITLWLFRW